MKIGRNDIYMVRNKFLLCFLIVVLFCSGLFSQTRIDTIIDVGWKFTRENPKDAESLNLNDAYWHKINLPHTWNALDGQDGGGDYYRGIGWYRKNLILDSSFSGKSIYLKIDAASSKATVFINGTEIGSHKGSFGAFCFNITPFVSFDKENVIAIKVTNAKDSTISPLRGDFTVFGGLYRSIHVLVLNPVSISPLDHASSGIYILQKNVSPEKSDIEITTEIENNNRVRKNISAHYTVISADSKIQQEIVQPIALDTTLRSVHSQSITILHPHLWNGRTDPYDYTLRVSLFDGEKQIDQVSQSFGLRYFKVDPDKGFYLNGKEYPLRGINRHQDRENMGWAITKKEHREDMDLIKEIGANTIRLCHYQHDPYFYTLCDSAGIVVWAELALVDEITACQEFTDICKQQLTELIKQNFNHPSIFFWSLENELIPDDMPDAYSRLIKELNTLAKTLDPSRLTTVATRSKYDCNEGMNSHSDVIGLNVYRGWYEKNPEDFAIYADEQHNAFPKRCLAISEYGAGGSIYQHEEPAKKPAPKGVWHPEEYQSLVHEITWNAMKERPYLWGTFIWNMFDFASDGRSEGDCLGRNDKGLVTYDRKIKKDAFYFYKANWNPDPMVYITSRRFTKRKKSLTSIKVYSNCENVQLFVNNVPLKMKGSNDHIFEWNKITLEEGKNTVRAEGIKGTVHVSDSCEWFFKSDFVNDNKK